MYRGRGWRPSTVALAHCALATAAALFGGLNVVVEVALTTEDGPSDSIKTTIGRSTCFALYRDVGAGIMAWRHACRHVFVGVHMHACVCGRVEAQMDPYMPPRLHKHMHI